MSTTIDVHHILTKYSHNIPRFTTFFQAQRRCRGVPRVSQRAFDGVVERFGVCQCLSVVATGVMGIMHKFSYKMMVNDG